MSISCGSGAFGGDPAPGVAKSCEYSVASGTGGKLEFRQGGTNAGTINAANSVFKIGSGYVVTGTLKTNSTSSLELGNSNLDLTGATLEIGGNVGLDKILTNNQTIFKLAEDATVTRNVGFTLGGIDLGGHTMTLGSATTDLTMNTSGGWKLIAKQANSDAQLFSSSARSTFLENENDSSQSTFMSIGNLNKNSYSDSDGKYKFKLVWGGRTVDSSGINKEVTWTQTSWLEDSSIQGFEEIGTSGHVTGNSGSGFRGLGKSSDSQCVIDGNGGSGSWWNCSGAIARHGGGIPAPQQKIASSSHLYIWESGTDTTDIPAGTLLTQAADLTIMGTQNIITGTTISSTGGEVTFKSELAISAGKVNLQDTTLVLEQGGGISGGGELDLSNSVLEISGQFHNNGGTFTTSGSTLRLTGNTNLANGGPLTFSNYEADGWRLNINDSATHLTLAGNVLLQPNNTVSSSSTSVNNKSLDFDGLDDYVATASNISELDITGDITIASWVNISSMPPSYFRIIGKGSGNNRTYGLWINSSGELLFQQYGSGGYANLNSNTTLSTGVWYHVLATRSGNTRTIYENGVADGTMTSSETPYSSTEPLKFGYWESDYAHYSGL
ncbi:MAG: LamG domain-containing protein, partial [SAR324 cluster bacterium]|nr:LamG domain-containing protein [SAR324 cluster bacterium]